MELLCLCRSGFEKEVAAEISEWAARLSVFGYVKAKANSSYTVFVCQQLEEAETLIEQIPFHQLTFVRHWFLTLGRSEQLDTDDRVTPLLAALMSHPSVLIFKVQRSIPMRVNPSRA